MEERKYTKDEIALASSTILATVRMAFLKSEDSKNEEKRKAFKNTEEFLVKFTARILDVLDIMNEEKDIRTEA